MPNLSVNELAQLTRKTRATVTRRLDGIPFLDGPKSAKLYPSHVALEKIYQGDESGGEFITNAEAPRLLTIARREQIDLEMEVTRKERIPLDVLEDVNDRAFSNVAGMLKAHEGKVLTTDGIADMLTELRSVSEVVRNG